MNRQNIYGLFNRFIALISGFFTWTNFWTLTLFVIFSLPFNLVLVAELVDAGHKSEQEIMAVDDHNMLVSITHEQIAETHKKTGIE